MQIAKVHKLSFPAWYLPSGKQRASDLELETASSSCERWAFWCGVLVVLSVVAELAIAFIEPPYQTFLKLSVWPDAIIGVGIVGEVLFGMRASSVETTLRERSNNKLGAAERIAAEANERAAEAVKTAEMERTARVKLEAQLAPRTLSKEQYEIILSLRGKIEAINVTSCGTYEASRFAAEITKTLCDAKIDARVCAHRIGLAWTSLYVVIPGKMEEFRLEPISATLRKAGMSVGCDTRVHVPLADLSPDIPVIMVGEKPPPLALPSYVFAMPAKVDESGRVIQEMTVAPTIREN